VQTVLTDKERRLVGNLSIPRNVADLTHQLRVDPHVDTEDLSEQSVHDQLVELAEHGLVVNLGDGRDLSSGELAAKVDGHKKAVSMPDEKAKIFEARLTVPHRRWRLSGDVWHFTDDALEMLVSGAVDAPAPLPLDQLERVIREEQKRIFDGDRSKLDDNNGPSIGQKLLQDEFSRWAKDVAKAHKDRTGEKVNLPMAGGMPGYSDAWENLGIDAENGKGTGFQITAPWYMALTTVAVTDADTGSTITEANYTGYARKSVAAADMGASAAGSAANSAVIQFAACTAGTSTVIGFAKCIAATVGVMQKYGTCASTTVSTTQTPAQFAIGAFTTSLD
jgi:hypothetical protein